MLTSIRHTVMREPNLIGLGKRPDLTPSHQVDLLMGIIAGLGGIHLGSPNMSLIRKYPDSGKYLIASPINFAGELERKGFGRAKK